MKLTPLVETLVGKRVVMVDDSIVRGTTTKRIVRLLREAGAREVHVRISSPPDRFPCHYGIDTGDRRELIAAKKSVEEICQFIEAESLGYLSLTGVLRAIGVPRGNFCRACFDGRYPVFIPRNVQLGKYALEGAPTHVPAGEPIAAGQVERGRDGPEELSAPALPDADSDAGQPAPHLSRGG
jgi:amidophosphoribosyltransferase